MADSTYSVSIVAKDQASPVFRSLSAEAKKADSVLDSMGDGALTALQAIERNTAEAAASLRDFGKASQEAGKATKEAEAGTKGFGESLNRIGAGFGVALTGASLLGQAYVNQERQLDSLRRQYGDAGGEIIQFTEHIQDSTRYSNDAARDAASLAAVLVSSYGLSTQQVETLLERTADLAQTSGLSFVDAAERTTSAIRGEAESAERLNLTLSQSQVAAYAAAQAQIDNNTALSQAEQGQLRYALFLEQSTYAQGAAGDAAATTAGQTQQLVNQLQDAAQGAGGLIGPVGEVASVLGIASIAAVPLGSQLGTVATAAKTTGTLLAGLRVGGLAVGAALGPIGLAATGVGLAALAIYKVVDAANDAEEAANRLGDSLEHSFGEALVAGANQDQLVALQTDINGVIETYDRLHEAAATAYFRPSTDPNALNSVGLLELADAAEFSTDQLGELQSAYTDLVSYIYLQAGPNAANVSAAFADLNNQYTTNAIGADEYVARLNELVGAMNTVGLVTVDANTGLITLNLGATQAAAGVDLLTYSLLDGNDAASEFSTALDGIFEYADRHGTSAEAGFRAYIDQLREVERLQLAAGNIPGATETQAVIDEATDYLMDAYAERARAIGAGAGEVLSAYGEARDAENAARAATIDDMRQQYQAQLDLDRQHADARAESIQSLEDTYRDSLFTPIDAPFLDGLDEMVEAGDLQEDQADRITGAFDRLQVSGASTFEIVNGLGESMGYASSESVTFASGLERASGALSAANDLIIGTTDNLSGLFDASAGLANDLFGGDPNDGLGTLVDLLNAGLITQQQFNDARDAGVGILDDQLAAEQSLNTIRALQLPYLQEQTAAMSDYLAMVAALPEDEQRRTLYLQDQANQQNLLNTETALYAASIGELPTEYVTDLILNRAAYDPEYARILEEQGVLRRNPITQEYEVVVPDGTSTVEVLTTLNSTLEELSDILRDLGGLPDPFGSLTASARILAAVSFGNLEHLPKPPPGAIGRGDGLERGLPASDPGTDPGYVPSPDPTLPGSPYARHPDGSPVVNPGGRPAGGQLPSQPVSQTVTIDYVANTDEAVAHVGALDVLTTGLTDGEHYVVVDSDVTQAGSDLAGIQGQVRILDENGAEVYVGADDGVALDAMDGVLGQIRIVDEATGTVYVYGEASDAVGHITGATDALKFADGSIATLFALGDSSDALRHAGEAAAAFDGVNGKSALLFAQGDSSGAENAAAVGAAAVYGVDGTTGYLYVEGVDNYSGVIAAAGAYAGSVIGTAFFDVVTRNKTQFGGFSNGGVVGYDGYANGGVLPTAALGHVIVGEAGPEIATLPGGTLITPSLASQGIAKTMRGDGGHVFNIYMQGTYVGNEDFAGAIYDGLQQAAEMQRASIGGR